MYDNRRNDCNSREKMMRTVQNHSFAVYEATLYLDAHPCDEKALDYFEKQQALLENAVEAYEKHYGPLSIKGVKNDDGYFSWVRDPWPWEYQA